MRLHFEMTGDGNHNVLLMPGALGEHRPLVKETRSVTMNIFRKKNLFILNHL